MRSGHQRLPRKTGRVPKRASRNSEGLTNAMALFVLQYLANHGNGAAAYRASHPNCRSDNAAAAAASRLLRNVKVRNFLEREQEPRRDRLRIDGDEAIALLSIIACANIGDLFDEHGKLLPVHQWSEHMQLCVKSIKPGRFGTAITLHDALKARELLAIAGGKLRAARGVNDTFDCLNYLAIKTPTPVDC